MADPLLELLASCVVRIDRDGEFSGTGFFVAPGEILTCAHVVHGKASITVILPDGTTHPAEPITPLLAVDDPAAAFYPYPDAVLLRVTHSLAHPCVVLDTATPAVGDRIQLVGFTIGEHAADVASRSGATLHVESLPNEDGHQLIKLREGQVIGGFSGGPLLNRRTGAVTALIESTRSPTSTLGGFGVPITVIAATLDADLLRRNTATTTDGLWAAAAAAQAEAEATRAGQRMLLPLLDMVVPLDAGEDFAPSDLLRPRHAVVPFVPRGDLLDQVMRWRESDTALSVMVLAGGGGFGKTRTALEISRAAEAAGWTAGLIDADEAGVDGLNELVTWPGRLLVAVDYAETRPDLVSALLRRLRRRRLPAASRVVLVVRQRADRHTLIDLFAAGDAHEEIAGLLRRAEWVGLGVRERELDHLALLHAATTAFTTLATGRDRRPPIATATPDLSAEHFDRPLFVLAAALLATQDPVLDVGGLSEKRLLGEVLDRHESRYWQRAADRLGLDLHPDDQQIAVAVMATAGLWSDTADTALVRTVPALSDANAERVMLVVRWLRTLYGNNGVLEPDLLAETLVGRVITAEPGLLARVMDLASDRQVTRCLIILARISVEDEKFRQLAYRSLRSRNDFLDLMDSRANFVSLSRLLGFEIGSNLESTLSGHGIRREDVHKVLTEFRDMANLAVRMLAKDNPAKYLPELAANLYKSSEYYSAIGEKSTLRRRLTEALEAYETMTHLQIDFDQKEFEVIVIIFAREASDHAVELLSEGKSQSALTQIRASVAAYAKLSSEAAHSRTREIAQVYVNHACILGQVYGQEYDDVLRAVQAALKLYEKMPSESHDLAYFLALGQAYEQEACALSATGSLAESAASASRSAQAYRIHTRASTESLPRLAMVELFQAQTLLQLREGDLAQDVASQAVLSFEQLCDGGFAEYGDYFQRAVSVLSEAVLLRAYSSLSARDLEVHAWRRLALRTGHGRSRLATLLTDRAALLVRLGFTDDALAHIDEATRAFRSDMAQAGSAGRQNLMTSLNNMAFILRSLGREAEAEEFEGQVRGLTISGGEADNA